MKIVTRLSYLVLIVIILFLLHDSLSVAEPMGYVEVSGKAFLADTTGHSGIRVLFQAISPSAVTDSAITDSQGNFSRLLEIGIYDLVYSKNDYLPYQIPGSRLFKADTVLSEVTLEPGIADTLSGNLSGRLYSNTVYFIDGGIFVQSGDTLIIEPATSIRFLDDYSFTINGLLLAQGAEGDSITFTSANPALSKGDWQGIIVSYAADSNSVLSYCRVQFATTGILCSKSLNISNCRLQNFVDYGIRGGSPKISNCIIQNDGSGTGISSCQSTINHCIVKNAADGINSVHSVVNSTVQYCQRGIAYTDSIIQCLVTNNSTGIYYHSSSVNLNVVNSTIADNGNGISAARPYGEGGWVSVIKSNLQNNSAYGIAISYVNAKISTNIIRGSNTALYSSDNFNVEIENNDFFDNYNMFSGSSIPPHLGEIVTTNINGDSCDTYFNIYLDPAQVDPENGNFNLFSDSPCIDAGDASLAYDPDSTIADIGAYYYYQGSPPLAPVAEFIASPLIDTVPHPVTFTNLSAGAITSYLWHFGDGRTSTLREPAHYYTEPDTYSVSLTVTGPGGTDVEVKADYIIALPDTSPPHADFSANPTSGYAPLEVAFDDLSTGLVDSVTWYFGDGDSSKVEKPLHTYTAPDTYTVHLVAYGPYGTDEEIKTDYVKVQEAPSIEAVFSAAPLIGVAPMGVSFTDQSFGVIDTWQWSFGDGDSSFIQNPIHMYDTPGDYDISLRVLGPYGEDTGVKTDYIHVYMEEPAIDSIADVSNDQGGWVYLYFTRSGYDHTGETINPVTDYYLYRRIDETALLHAVREQGESIDEREHRDLYSTVEIGSIPRLTDGSTLFRLDGNLYVEAAASGEMPPGIWAIVGSVPGYQQEQYIYLLPTVADSSASFIYSVYCVSAATTVPSIFFFSEPDSGYSVDNIAPALPLGFAVAYNAGSNELTWDECIEEDFQYFRVYREESEDFNPAPENLVYTTLETNWLDVDGTWKHYYKLSTVDYAGNESVAIGPGTITGTNDVQMVPTTFVLYQNMPNPFNPTTTIRFDLPRAVNVKLCVYNVRGELVSTIADRQMSEGNKEFVWTALDERGRAVSSGIYFYRLLAGDFVQTRKMVLLR